MTPTPQPIIIIIVQYGDPAPLWFKILMAVWIGVLIGVAIWAVAATWRR